VTLSYNGPLVLGAGNIASGNLNITNSGNITQAVNTTLAVGGTATFNAGNGVITLGNANAFTGAVSLTNAGAFDVALNNGKALVLGTSSIASGNLVVSATGNITQAANTTLAVSGNATFSASNGAINLNQANLLSGDVFLSNTGANAVTVNNNRAIVLANVSIPTGNLAVSANGNITQATNTTLTVGGTSGFAATNGAITLNQANALTGAISLTNSGAKDVTLINNQAIVLGNVNVALGNLTVLAYYGNITRAPNATLDVGGSLSVSAANGTVHL